MQRWSMNIQEREEIWWGRESGCNMQRSNVVMNNGIVWVYLI